MKSVVVIGGGAAGMAAAITAARNGARVTVLEKGKEACKKLTMTGNGRCNISNTEMDPACYNDEAAARFSSLFDERSVDTVINFMRSLGVLVRSEEGYLYPVSGQALSVSRALVSEAARLGVEVRYEAQVKGVAAAGDETGLKVTYMNLQGGGAAEEIGADAVVLACGALSGPKSTGSTGDGYYIAEKNGMTVTQRLPALVKLLSGDRDLPRERGVRMWGNVSFFLEDGSLIAEEYGEIQITSEGISGIPVLQASRQVAKAVKEGKEVEARLDFFANIDRRRKVRAKDTDGVNEQRKKVNDSLYAEFVENYIAQFMKSGKVSAEEFLNGISNGYINELVMLREGVDREAAIDTLGEEKLKKMLMLYRGLPVNICDTGNYEEAQATSGGIALDELDDTLQAKKVPGLYVAGEVADVDGRCGGYNLHWAFLSGMIAGEAAVA